MRRFDFLIVALPRSRTAWLANFLTTDRTLCLHDYFGAARHGFQLPYDERMFGISDTLMGWHPTFVNDLRVRKVVIERDVGEVCESLDALKLPGITTAFVKQQAAQLAKVTDALRVRFEDIDARLEEIWAHCTGLPYDRLRAEQLKTFKIELTAATLARVVEREAA